MSTKFALLSAFCVMCCAVAYTRPSSTLATATDNEVANLFGGACGAKVDLVCNGAAEGCVATDCFKIEGVGAKKSSGLSPACGVLACGYVDTPVPCAIPH